MRTCAGGSCEVKADCRRWLERNLHPFGERFPVPPYKYHRTKDEDGNPINATHQECEHFEARDNG